MAFLVTAAHVKVLACKRTIPSFNKDASCTSAWGVGVNGSGAQAPGGRWELTGVAYRHEIDQIQ